MSRLLLCILLNQLIPSVFGLGTHNINDDMQHVMPETSWNINLTRMTEDGKWLVLRIRNWIPALKTSDFDNDTVILFNIQKSGDGKIAGTRLGVRFIEFTGNSSLLMSYADQAELLDLNKHSSSFFYSIKKTEYLKSTKQFVLHFGAGENNRLELRDDKGELLSSVDNVLKFYATEIGNVYTISEKEGNIFEIILLNSKNTKKMYVTSQEINTIEIDPNETGIMVFEKSSEKTPQNIIYLDFKTKENYSLNSVLPLIFQRGFTEVIQEGKSYFMKLWLSAVKENSQIVDIWYGNEKKLEEKFQQPIKVANFVWKPVNRTVQQIGNGKLINNINIGDERYFLSYDPYLLQDYSTEQPLLQLNVYDNLLGRYSIMDTIAPEFYLSAKGEYLLSPKNRMWYLYHIPFGRKMEICSTDNLRNPWFTDGEDAVVFEAEEALWMYGLNTGELSKITEFKGFETNIVNGTTIGFGAYKTRSGKKVVNLAEPLLIKLFDPKKNVTSYILWHKGKETTIIAPTENHIRSLNHDKTYTHFNYIEENYNMPPRLVYKEAGKKEKVLYKSNREDTAILSLKQEIISYTNKDGISLNGILYYPLHFNPSRKYPMVVRIYERQHHLSNKYPYSSYYEDLGFNIRLLIEKGYFVYLPDIVIQGKEGPGMDALDCVDNALDALNDNPFIDKHKIGLIGHSFGGYETNFIATHSTRFAAYVSGSGHSDIVWTYHAFNYNFLFPDHVRIEANMYKMGIPFSYNKRLYFENNPVYFAENVDAPVLLWAGLEDKNVTSEHSMAFYNALRKNKKNVIALFYKNEGHCLQNKEAQFDLTNKILDWFDYFLCDKMGIEWIDRGFLKKGTKQSTPLIT